MAKSSEPVVLDLAALPREQMGPFLMLGLDKTADKDAIEKHGPPPHTSATADLVKLPPNTESRSKINCSVALSR